MLKWLNSLPDKDKKTWSCSYCKQRNLQKARNCFNNYDAYPIKLTRTVYVKQCPISLIDSQAASLYEILNLSLKSGMGGYSPLELLKLPNVYFDYLRIIAEAEAAIEEE